MLELLGGKGAGLAEMTRLGMPVPPGFTISTEACSEFEKAGGRLSGAVKKEALAAMANVEKLLGRRFGDPADPLLVSVRSGARVSMPGMMDTVLNLGLNDETVVGLARLAGERFAYDSYRRLVQMYGDVVLEVPHDRFEDRLEALKTARGVVQDTELAGEDWRALVDDYLKIVEEYTGRPFPQDPRDQLWGAVGAVFHSWGNDRAVRYRRIHDIPDAWGTAVNVQAMVFGNMGDDCATGVAFTRDPSTGEKVFYGEYLKNAQGEDVVAGIRTPQPINKASRSADQSHLPTLEEEMPQAYKALVSVYKRLEKHFREMQDIEFTIQNGKLWMLQTRRGKRTTRAAVRIACDMVRERLDQPRGGDLPDRPRLPGPAAPSHPRPDGGAHRVGQGAARVPWGGGRQGGVQRRRSGAPGEGGRQGHPGADRDLARGHPRNARCRGDPHRPWWHDLPRGRRRTGHGKVLRVGMRSAPHRLRRRRDGGGRTRGERR